MKKATSKSLRAWLQLIRLPNLFTVPGDPLAGLAVGVALTGGSAVPLWPAMALSAALLCAYIFGLIVNDLNDLSEDQRLRPMRPLPLRLITVPQARISAGIFLAAALLLALLAGRGPLLVMAILIGIVILYDVSLKHSDAQGPLTMGLCRGLSMLTGAAAVGLPVPALLPALALTGYITAVTRLARREERAQNFDNEAFHPTLWLIAGFTLSALMLAWRIGPAQGLLAVMLILPGIGGSLRAARELTAGRARPELIQKNIGRLLRGTIFFQAGLLCLIPGWQTVAIAALLVLVAWPGSIITGRWFYAS